MQVLAITSTRLLPVQVRWLLAFLVANIAQRPKPSRTA